MPSREPLGDRPLRETDTRPPGPARRDDYLQWRQRIADKQASRREPTDALAGKRAERWDPQLLFAAEEAHPPEDGAEAIDLRESPITVVVEQPPEPSVDTPPPSPQAPARRSAPTARPRAAAAGAPSAPTAPNLDAPHRDARHAKFDSLMARLERRSISEPGAPSGPTIDVRNPSDGPMAVGSDRATPAPPDRSSVRDALRALNQRRLEGAISEDEFKARKADLFERTGGR